MCGGSLACGHLLRFNSVSVHTIRHRLFPANLRGGPGCPCPAGGPMARSGLGWSLHLPPLHLGSSSRRT
eukprot:2016078-Alexandrium_andersonii.AAC.1